ncbi:hypothetical protein [Streptomyces sp. NPDC002853]
MQILGFLTRRYTPAQFLALLLPSLIVLIAVHFAALGLGAEEQVAVAVSFLVSVAAAFLATVAVNRRVRA